MAKFLKVSNLEEISLNNVTNVFKSCLRCSDVSLTDDLSQHFVNYVCQTCRNDHNSWEVQRDEEVSES